MSCWEEYSIGKICEWKFSFSEIEMNAFAKLSSDYNPVHHSFEFARSKGFEGPIVYGALLVTQISRLIGNELPDKHCILTGINIEFHKPAYINQQLNFQATLVAKSESTHLLEFKVCINHNQYQVCRARVSAIWKA